MPSFINIKSQALIALSLTKGLECPNAIELQGSTCLLIDGMALVAAIGKPADSQYEESMQIASKLQY